MKLVLEKQALKEALNVLSSAVKKQPGKITSSVLFHAEDDRLVLKACDHFVYTHLVMAEETGLDDVKGEGAFTVEEARLSKWVSNVFEDYIEVEVEDNEVTFRSGSVESPFPSKDPNQFPSSNFDAAYESSEKMAEVTVGVLLEALSFVKDFVATTSSNSDPTGRLQIAQIRDRQFMGTDAKLLGIFKCDKLDSEWKIGSDHLGPAISYLKRQSEKDVVTIRRSDNHFFFELSDSSFFGFSKPRSDLPAITGIPTDLVEEEVWSLDKEHLKQAIGALRATADSEDNFLKVQLSGEGEGAEMDLKMSTFSGKRTAKVGVSCNRMKGSGHLEFAAAHTLLEQAISSYGDEITLAYDPIEKYLKLYEKTASGDIKNCLVTLREDVNT